jgi:outer membrane protein assembly factor BamB
MKATLGLLLAGCCLAHAGDQPQWGQAWSRNMVSAEKGLPDTFDPAAGHNVKWSTRLGNQTHSTPVIAGGRVYIGTNNEEPRDPRHSGDRGVLMCFEEQTGKFLWQLVVPKREEDVYHDWPRSGISSPATVQGDRVYIVSNRGEVMCLDAFGMANGNDGPFRGETQHMIPKGTNAAAKADTTAAGDGGTPSQGPPIEAGPNDADILWLTDLTAAAGIWSHDAAHSSILIYGDHLYLNSGTGVDNTHKRIRTPEAPSLVVLDKRTGRLIGRDRLGIAPDIFHATWSSPSLSEVEGKTFLFFGAGNGILYAFSPLGNITAETVQTLNLVWQFDFDPAAPKTNVHRFNSNRREGPSNFYGMPVVHDGLVYLSGGGDFWWGKNEAWLKCIRARGSGDTTGQNLIWSYPLQKHVMSTPAIDHGLVFIADCGRTFHCLQADIGKVLWTHEIKGDVWASPLVADGKVYLGTRSGTFYVFESSRTKSVLSTIELGSPISATAAAANGVLYVATMDRLFALRK